MTKKLFCSSLLNNNKGVIWLTLIKCSANCCHQKDGYCAHDDTHVDSRLRAENSLALPRENNECLYFEPGQNREQGSGVS